MTVSTSQKSALAALLSFVSGLMFAAGLALAGMTQPDKVIGFLDLAGPWDPSLGFVMLGAIAVYFTANRFVRTRLAPWLGDDFHLPTRRDLEPKLVMGSALFGVGWGLAGYCPGPGITALATGATGASVFVLSMAVGMLSFEALQRRLTSSGKRRHERASVECPRSDGYQGN